MTPPKTARYFWLFGLVAVGVALVAGPGCTRDAGAGGDSQDDKAEGERKDGNPVPVEVVDLETGPIESLLRFSVNIEAERQVEVLARAPGQVIGLAVEEGDEVKKGALLLRIEDDEAASQVAKVELDLELATRDHEKQKTMHERGLVSDQQLDKAAHERSALEIALRDARRALRYTRVRAPIGGTVSKRLVELGDYVKPQQPLFEITDFDSLVARVYPPESVMAALAEGLEARVRAQGANAEAHVGVVDRIAPVIDASSGTVKTTVAIPQSEGLRPGMFVDVELVTERRDDALRLPKRALVYDEEQPFVFRVVEGEEGQKVERVRVDPEIEDRHFVLPRSGLSAGDTVVVAGQVGLKNGARVNAKPAAAMAASARERVGGDAGTDSGERVQ